MDKNNKKNNRQNFSKNFNSKPKFMKSPDVNERATEKKIEDISGEKESISVTAQISKVVQTGGPTVFVVSDGTGNLSLKGFIKPGVRAYPEIVEGMIVRAVVEIGEFQGEIEGEIKSIKVLDEANKKHFLEGMGEIEKERAKVVVPNFLVESNILS